MSDESLFLKNKSIIVVIPNDFGLPALFRKNLEFLGMKVYLLPYAEAYPKISFPDTCKHIFRKMFRRDRSYKKSILDRNHAEDNRILHLKTLSEIPGKTDYALVLRPDLVDDAVIERIKQSAGKMVGYQWDGLGRYPGIRDKIKYFEHFFVFDKKDLKPGSPFRLIHNFYFDHDLEGNSLPENDVFFIGSHIDSRMPKLEEIAAYLKKNGFKTSINVMGSSRRYIKKNPQSGITYIGQILPFQENYSRIKKSRVILDLVNNVHSGLSFRVFESIGLKKKLITDNPEVKNYDFYDENNIFVLDDSNIEDLSAFIQAPYKELDASVVKKYSFGHWIRQILEIPVKP